MRKLIELWRNEITLEDYYQYKLNKQNRSKYDYDGSWVSNKLIDQAAPSEIKFGSEPDSIISKIFRIAFRPFPSKSKIDRIWEESNSGKQA